MSTASPWTIAGQGLAGTCLAWNLHGLGVPFHIIDPGTGGASRVAAGLINPVTGKNFEPSPGIASFLREAIAFYHSIEATLGIRVWHPLPVLRLASSPAEWRKMRTKSALPEVAPWVIDDDADPGHGDWCGAMRIGGGGRLDTRAFLDASRSFFMESDRLSETSINPDHPPAGTIWCDGAEGLTRGRLGPHRCAKGEILTLQARGWDESHIRVGAGGWLVPLGDGRFKCGATYEWQELDAKPTPHGRAKVETIARRLGGTDFEVIAHEAGVRPILRRSQPVIGPLSPGTWAFNGLGSKGSLYAPGTAARLARWLVDDVPAEAWLDGRRIQC